MKKNLVSLFVLLTTITLCGCTKKQGEKKELVIFAAASMQESLTELGNQYMNEYSDIQLVYNFDSSGTLKTQIQEGANADIFISAGQKQMDQLDINADPSINTEKLDYVLKETRFDILENKVVLAVANENANITSYDEMITALKKKEIKLAIGNEDVPVGQYTKKIFDYYGLSEQELNDTGCLTYGTNVKEVTTQISEGLVDSGIIYHTDAYSANLNAVDYATKEMCGQVIYPAAVLNISNHQDEAIKFLEYLQSDVADEVFSNVGFTPLK